MISFCQVCSRGEGAERVHPPEARRRHHPAPGRKAVHGLPSLGEWGWGPPRVRGLPPF